MLVLRSILALAAAATVVSAHSGRPNTAVAFGPDLSHVQIREVRHDVVAPVPRVEFVSRAASVRKTGSLRGDKVQVVLEYAKAKLESALAASNIKSDSKHSVIVTDSYTSDHSGITHVYLIQTIDDIEVVNGVANANIDKHGNILSFSSTFYNGSAPKSSDETAVFQDQQLGHRLGRRHYGRKHREEKKKEEDSDSSDSSDSSDDEGREGRHHKKHDKKMHKKEKKYHKKKDALKHRLSGPHTWGDIISPEDALLSFSKDYSLGIGKHHLVETEAFTSLKPSRTDPDFTIRLTNPSSAAYSSKDSQLPPTVPAKYKYIQTSDGELVPVWDLQGHTVQLVDWVSDASYNIFPIGTNDPVDGDRVLVEDPAHPVGSPHGWHAKLEGKKLANYTVTVGNNVYAHENLNGKNDWKNKVRPDGTDALVFDFPADLATQQPSEYLDAAVTNLFYWNNAIHDLFYLYGFTEKAGNFQEDNLGRGGDGEDGVIANAQDGSGYNNANFATPPDGGHGRMRMYVWDQTDPMRDGDFEGGIIMHEYAHGISIRLTGGPKNSGCLGWGEAGGMGEGWGDYFATILRTTSNSTRKDVMEWENIPAVVLYSTSKEINPSTYSYVAKPAYWGVHAKGEVWAEILYEFFWDLVDIHGYNPNWYDTPLNDEVSVQSSTYRDFRTGKVLPNPFKASSTKKFKRGGNVLALQLVVDGLKIQPCYPSFVDARDAIITADHGLTGGENACVIWKAFARRGLGEKAKSGGREDFTVPKKCE
ncbi:Fungalysin metallopeptidase-domain-containing protein [Chytridium lagenaria]|nr:Fungalysin metallopeptidase-domain-containing protein [Chytridium lagenaria]